MSDSTWLPNLVGGTSIWKLAVDLNEPKFFDGRLLVPETEGSESLPVTVRWDLTGLVPFREAQEKHAEATTAAIAAFQAALQNVAKVFSTPNSGFDKYKEAFTVPSLEADGGANYFFSPTQKKLFVINWGASPRSMGGRSEYVFGYEDWGKQWTIPVVAAAGGAALGAAAVTAATSTDKKLDTANANDEKKREAEKKTEGKARAWWFWPLFGLVAIALVLLALFLLKACDEQKPTGLGGADALVEGAVATDGAPTADGAAADGAASAGGDASTDASATGGDSGADAGADAASSDGGSDAGKTGDGGADGGPTSDDDDDDFPESSSGGIGPGGSSGGTVIVKVGPGGGQKTSVHRKHYSDEAVKWRITTGAKKVSRTEEAGKRFDVWLSPGQTFEGVRVEWQDKSGKWHVH